MVRLKHIIHKLNSDLILLVVLIGLVLISTEVKFTFIYGITFTFSSIFMFLILRIYKFSAAIIAGLFAIVFVHSDVHNVYQSVLMLLEIAFVGAFFIRGRKAKMFFVDALFWILIGAVLLIFIYRPSLNGNALYFQISKDIMNGLFNVLIADMLLAYFPFYRFVKNNRVNKNSVSIHQFVSHITIFSILVPFFISLLTTTWNAYDSTYNDLILKADSRANRIENELLFWKKADLEKLTVHEDEAVKKLEDLIWRNKSYENEILIVDDTNTIIASTLPKGILTTEYEFNKLYEVKEVSPNLYEALPIKHDNAQPIIQWSEGMYFYASIVGPVKIILQFPIAQYQEEIFSVSLEQLKYLLLFALCMIILVTAVSRMLTTNLRQLTIVTTGLPQKLRSFETIEWPQSAISELRILTKNLKKMADKLKELFKESIEMNEILSEQTIRLKESEDKLHRLAFYDGLTSLPNRYYFQRFVRELIRTDLNKKIAIIFLDLNQFKQINDTLGHDAGDALLKLTANKLKKLQLDDREVFRLGGDEFVVVHCFEEEEDLSKTVALILKEFSTHFDISGQAHYITTSVGVSIYPDDGEDLDTLVKYADIAMYMSKEKGGNSVHFFDESMRDKFQQRLIIENALRTAVDYGKFEQYYQPKTNAGKVTSMEALLRWNDAELGGVSPSLFIPIAEEIGLISQIDEWSLLKACRQNKEWQDEGLIFVPVSVNISAKHFQQDLLVSMVQKALDESGLDPKYVKLEITESVFIKDPQHVAIVINQLKELGVQLSIDDFGKGYSSLYQILQLPIDEIKIDRQFIRNIDQNEKQALLVKSVFDIAHGLHLNVVAEGVETTNESKLLERMGCDEIQGYLYSPPISKEDMEHFLKNQMDN